MKFFGLIAIAIVILFFAIPGPHGRFGRDLIFYSGDVDQFLLPNGKLVDTNEWYDWDEVLSADQEFFTQSCEDHADGKRLGIVGVDGFSIAAPADHVDINNNRTHVDEDDPGASFQEFWVRNGTAEHAK
jgi:hypothetical protein